MLDGHALRDGAEAGDSIRKLSEQTGASTAAVRRRLSQLGLQTVQQRLRQTARAAGATRITLRCPDHGEIEHRMDARGTYRCPVCITSRVARHRRTVKEILVAEAGGRCASCSYDRCVRALGFHHTDPSERSFGIALGGMTRSLERSRAEAQKCVLLCANCHMEVEEGLV